MEKCSYFGNPWIGMFIKTNDAITLLPVDAMGKTEKSLESNLQTEIIRTTIADSNLIGIYTVMNSNGIVLPNVVTEKEASVIRKTGLNVYRSAAKNNAHGNNISVNDKGGVANVHVDSQEIKKMEDVLGVELVATSVAGYNTVGSCVITTNAGFLAHYKASEDELKELKKLLKVSGSKGTVNTGTGFVSYGLVVNSKGYVAGEATTAFELGRAEEALGLIR